MLLIVSSMALVAFGSALLAGAISSATWSVKDVATVASPIGASFVFAFGVVQYRQAQNWKRIEYARSLLARLEDDEDLSLCRLFIDWSPRRIAVPQGYSILVHTGKATDVYRHDWRQLHEALSKPEDSDFEWWEVMYRDKFDTFFSYLQELNRCMILRLVLAEDLVGLQYWIRKIAETRVMEAGPLVFRAFVEEYYLEISQLMARFHVAWKDTTVVH